jgi:hypothetical protein
MSFFGSVLSNFALGKKVQSFPFKLFGFWLVALSLIASLFYIKHLTTQYSEAQVKIGEINANLITAKAAVSDLQKQVVQSTESRKIDAVVSDIVEKEITHKRAIRKKVAKEVVTKIEEVKNNEQLTVVEKETEISSIRIETIQFAYNHAIESSN